MMCNIFVLFVLLNLSRIYVSCPPDTATFAVSAFFFAMVMVKFGRDAVRKHIFAEI